MVTKFHSATGKTESCNGILKIVNVLFLRESVSCMMLVFTWLPITSLCCIFLLSQIAQNKTMATSSKMNALLLLLALAHSKNQKKTWRQKHLILQGRRRRIVFVP